MKLIFAPRITIHVSPRGIAVLLYVLHALGFL